MNLSFLSARPRNSSNRDGNAETGIIEGDALALLARLVYQEMNVEPRRMHVAIDIAKEQLRGLRQVLVRRGLRRSDSSDPE
jgi:hypothetical protein